MRARFFVAALLLAAPALQAQTIGPKKDRYELVVAKPAATAYALALRVLTDSTFRIAQGSPEAGLIQTEWRTQDDVAELGAKAALKRSFLKQEPIRLSFVLTPVGSDSTRLTLSGDFKIENINRTMKVMTNDKQSWKILQGVGDAVLALAAGY